MKRTALLLTALLLVGCSSTEVAPTPEPSDEPTAEFNVPDALERTQAEGSAAMGVLVLTTIGAEEAAVDGRGIIDFGSGAAEVLWSDELGDVIERKTSDGLFVQLDPPDGGWFRFDESNATPTSYALSPFTDVQSVTNFVDEGVERIDGLSTTRFVGTIPAQDCIRGAGFSVEDEEQFGPDVVCGVTVWIDETGVIVRIDRVFGATTSDDQEARSVRSTTFSDFSGAVQIDTPDSFEEAPEGP